MDTLLKDKFDVELEEELNSYNLFLNEFELEKGRHCVFNSAISSFNNTFLNQNLDYVLDQLNCEAKVNLAFGVFVEIIEDGTCSYFYGHKSNTVMERS